jgi:hypothetical protein
MLVALTAFLAPYRDGRAAAHTPRAGRGAHALGHHFSKSEPETSARAGG